MPTYVKNEKDFEKNFKTIEADWKAIKKGVKAFRLKKKKEDAKNSTPTLINLDSTLYKNLKKAASVKKIDLEELIKMLILEAYLRMKKKT